jgi:hypothetical protein
MEVTQGHGFAKVTNERGAEVGPEMKTKRLPCDHKITSKNRLAMVFSKAIHINFIHRFQRSHLDPKKKKLWEREKKRKNKSSLPKAIPKDE